MVDLEKRDKGNDDNLKRKPHGFDAVLGILKNIYEGIRVKLLKVAHIEDVSQEEGVDEKSQKDFLGFSVKDVEEKYMRYDGRRNADMVNMSALLCDLEKSLQDYLDSFGEISDDFYKEIYRLSLEYKNLKVGHCEQYNSAKAGLKYAELAVLIKNPKLIKDQRIIEILELISDLQNAVPWGFQMFSTLNENDERVLYKGITMQEHLSAFMNMIKNKKLWADEVSHNRAEMRRIFLSSIAEAIALMTEEDHELTYPARFRVLTICADYSADTEFVVNNLFFTFLKKEIQSLKNSAEWYLKISKQRSFFDNLIKLLEEKENL